VTADKGSDLKHNGLTVTYAWEEQGREKTFQKKVDKVPFEATVEVGGEAMPRMKSVTVAVAP